MDTLPYLLDDVAPGVESGADVGAVRVQTGGQGVAVGCWGRGSLATAASGAKGHLA